MKTYRGYRVDGGCAVEVVCGPLVLRGGKSPSPCVPEDLYGTGTYFLRARRDIGQYGSHQIGFNWGYSGSGPSQLAVALLNDALGWEVARDCWRDFQSEVIAAMADDRWEMTEDAIRDWHASWRSRSQEESPRELVSA